MTETTVILSLITNSNGEFKTRLDKASKAKVKESENSEEERPISPTLSLISSISTIVSNATSASESLHHGTRRRVESFSTESVVSSTLFDGDDEDLTLRTSTPLPLEDDLSDVSFASCVSELSIKTTSSQETIKNEVIETKNKMSYEQVNKERFKKEIKEEDNWRNAPRRVSDKKPSPPKASPSNTSSAKRLTPSYRPIIIGSSVSSASRIPSPLDRSMVSPSLTAPKSSKVAPPPRVLPDRRVSANVGSYASAASNRTLPDFRKNMVSSGDWRTVMSKNRTTTQSPVHAPAPASAQNALAPKKAPITEQTITLTLITGSDGKMRLQFSNSTTSESWLIDGIASDAQNVNVHKIQE